MPAVDSELGDVRAVLDQHRHAPLVANAKRLQQPVVDDLHVPLHIVFQHLPLLEKFFLKDLWPVPLHRAHRLLPHSFQILVLLLHPVVLPRQDAAEQRAFEIASLPLQVVHAEPLRVRLDKPDDGAKLVLVLGRHGVELKHRLCLFVVLRLLEILFCRVDQFLCSLLFGQTSTLFLVCGVQMVQCSFEHFFVLRIALVLARVHQVHIRDEVSGLPAALDEQHRRPEVH
mmetsp:Transcript_16235/g.38624  ORF Transcript_16235/g.38624 Transcript_16235/m.38624 type:complete len:228 (-) Transcript_16235:562-1245(-)